MTATLQHLLAIVACAVVIPAQAQTTPWPATRAPADGYTLLLAAFTARP